MGEQEDEELQKGLISLVLFGPRSSFLLNFGGLANLNIDRALFFF